MNNILNVFFSTPTTTAAETTTTATTYDYTTAQSYYDTTAWQTYSWPQTYYDTQDHTSLMHSEYINESLNDLELIGLYFFNIFYLG